MGTPLERKIEVRRLTPNGGQLVRVGEIHFAVAGGEITPIAGLRIKNLSTGEIKRPLASGIKS